MKKPIRFRNYLRHWKKLLLAIILLVALFYITDLFSKEDEFPTFTVEWGRFVVDIEARGEVKASDSHVISSPSKVWGNIRIVKLVDEGSYVEPGDFLIQFDAAEFQQRLQTEQNNLETALANHESKLANIRKQMADLESQLKIEEYNLEQNRLQAKNAIYEAENKRKEIEYSLKKAEVSYAQLKERITTTRKINAATLRQSELQIEQARLNVERAQADLSQLTIVSPAEGLVVYREVWGPGGREKVKVGSSPWRNQPLLEIPDQSGMKVELPVNEVDISRLEIGQRADIRLDAIVDTIFSGEVTEIARLAHRDRRSDKNVFDIEIRIDDTDERIKPGMSANCRIFVEELEDTLFVPIDAIVHREDQTGVLDRKGAFRAVQTGPSNADFIVVHSGLRAGEVIRLKKSVGTMRKAPENQNRAPKPRRREHVVIMG